MPQAATARPLSKEESDKARRKLEDCLGHLFREVEELTSPQGPKEAIEARVKSTRPPNIYDGHLPTPLQPRSIAINSSEHENISSSTFLNRLLKEPSHASQLLRFIHAATEEDLGKFRLLWSRDLCRVGGQVVTSELGVTNHQRMLYEVVCRLACLLIFPLESEQIHGLYLNSPLEVTPENPENRTAVADLLIGMLDARNVRKKHTGGEELQTLVGSKAKYDPYIRPFSSLEVKCVELGNPLLHLNLLLFGLLMEIKALEPSMFWADLCEKCSTYSLAHKALDARGADDAIRDENSPKDSVFTTEKLQCLDSERLKARRDAIRQLCETMIAGKHAAVVEDAAAAEDTASATAASGGHEEHAGFKFIKSLMEELWEKIPHSPGLPSNLGRISVRAVLRWSSTARYIFIQIWSHMVHHNLTIATLTTHNLSFNVFRQRETGQAILTPLELCQDPGHIPRKAILIADAWQDASERCDAEADAGVKPWTRLKPYFADYYRSAPDSDTDTDDDGQDKSDSSDDELRLSGTFPAELTYPPVGELGTDFPKRGTGPGGKHESSVDTDEENQEDEDEDEDEEMAETTDEDRPPPNGKGPGGSGPGGPRRGGGNGGAGSGNTRSIAPSNANQSSSGGKPTAESSKRKYGDSGRAEPGKRSKRSYRLADVQVIPEDLHLAFVCPDQSLESSGFMRFERMDIGAKIGTPPSPPPHHPRSLVSFPTSGLPSTPPLGPRRALVSSVPAVRGTTTSFSSLGSNSSTGTGTPGSAGSSTGSGDSSLLDTPQSNVRGVGTYEGLSLGSPTSKLTPSRRDGEPELLIPTAFQSSEENAELGSASTQLEHDAPMTGPQLLEKQPVQPQMLVDHVGVILTRRLAERTSVAVPWAGDMFLEGVNGLVEPVHIVLKFGELYTDPGEGTQSGRAIRREAKTYKMIEDLSPKTDVVPRYFGLFEHSESGTVALLLHYRGKRLRQFSDLTIQGKETLLQKAVALHNLGIEHHDLWPRNIVVNKRGEPIIIDLRRAEKHECRGVDHCKELQTLKKELNL